MTDRPEAPASAADLAVVTTQLGREPRGVVGVAHRCPCGQPDTVATHPRLPDGTPFPTTYYLSCPRLTGAVSTLEASGVMRAMSRRLGADADLAARYRGAHEAYLAQRDARTHVPEVSGVSAGGMPDRVKCLHALVAHALAAGSGVNPLGDEALEALPPWWTQGAVRTAPGGVDEVSGTRVGALDCGTNSLRLLVTELDPATGTQVDLDRRLRIVRLGEGVDRTGRLDPAALRRALRVVEEYADVCAEHAVEHVRVGATSAVRDAANAGVFAAGVHDVLSVVPEVLTGKEEARLTATGALRGLAGHAELGDPVLVVDIGGGSTELVQATGTRGAGGAVQAADGAVRVRAGCSLDVGSVRLTERHLHSDPSTPAQRQAATADVDAALDTTTTDWDALAAAVGVAGTVTSVAAHVLGQRTYDARRVHGATLARADVLAACRWLAQASIAQRLERLPWLPPGRADVIGGGALVLERVLLRLSPRVVELVVSEQDILDGLAWSLVEP